MQEARFYEQLDEGRVRCLLCPWYCELQPGQTGICRVRKNTGGKLVTYVYNKVAALGIDPVEKKPLYHFMPGRYVLSLGLTGCNLRCTFCQNHNISQCPAETYDGFRAITSSRLVEEALNIANNAGLAYTYNEPFTFFEFLYDTALLAHEAGLKNIVVSNGYINQPPLKILMPVIDAFNIDIKAFDEKFYRQQTKGKAAPVFKSIVAIANSTAHLELTNLVIPGLNDEESRFTKMVKWIAGETGPDTPLHLSGYYPGYKLHASATTMEKLEQLYEIAKKYLHYVYVGNKGYGYWSDTRCPWCGTLLVARQHGKISTGNLSGGDCTGCGKHINIIY